MLRGLFRHNALQRNYIFSQEYCQKEYRRHRDKVYTYPLKAQDPCFWQTKLRRFLFQSRLCWNVLLQLFRRFHRRYPMSRRNKHNLKLIRRQGLLKKTVDTAFKIFSAVIYGYNNRYLVFKIRHSRKSFTIILHYILQ